MTIQQFIEQRNKAVIVEKGVPEFLLLKRDEFFQKLENLDFDVKAIEQILEEGIPTPDVNLVIELANYNQKQQAKKTKKRRKKHAEQRYEEADEDGWEVTKPSGKSGSKIKYREYQVNPYRSVDAENHSAKMKQNLEATQVMIENKDKDIIEAKST